MRIIVALLIGVMFLSGCSITNTESNKNSSTNNSQEKAVFSDENFAVLASCPNKYKGSSAEVSGQLIGKKAIKDNQTMVIMRKEIDQTEKFVVFTYKRELEQHAGDFLKVYGKVGGRLQRRKNNSR